MLRRLAAWVTVAAASVATSPRTATAEDNFAAGKQRAEERFLEQLNGLARWCETSRLFASRNRLLETVLTLRPDDPHGRTVLGWSRKGRTWVRTAGYKEPHDWNDESKPTLESKRAAILTSYRNDVLASIEGAEPGLDPAVRKKTLKELSRTLPGDEMIGKALDYVLHEGRWMHPDTRRTRIRRAEIDGLLARARAAAKAVGLDAGAKAGGATCRTEHLSVRGTAEPAEMLAIAQAAEVASTFARAMLARESKWSPSEYLVFATKSDAKAYFLADPRLGPVRWKDGDKLSGLWIPQTDTVLLYAGTAEQRVMDATRQAIGGTMILKGSESRGWYAEGAGQYLTWMLTGKHDQLWGHVSRTGGVGATPDESPEDLPDWLTQAEALLRRPAGTDRPTLRLLLSMRLGGVTSESAFLGFAFAQYLFEARSDRALEFIRANEVSDDPDAYCNRVLGMSPEALEERLLEWIGDMR